MRDPEIDALIEKEKWSVVVRNGVDKIKVFNKLYKYTHPVAIWLRRYKKEKNPDLKYIYMRRVHDYLWPNALWNQWTEIRFREHCKGWTIISHAGGSSTGKSYDLAKICIIFWLANPTQRRVVVCSTTLESSESRCWGYITHLLGSMDVIIPFKFYGGRPPKIMCVPDPKTRIKNTLCGIYLIAAKRGDNKDTLSNLIGVHPEDALMLCLDEGPMLPLAMSEALINLDSGKKPFQCHILGNSDSIFDLHGSLSTPKVGWANIDPMRDTQWETTQRNGLCIFYSCYNSPGIHEPDPIKRKKLSRFFIDQEGIDSKIKQYGKDSDQFYRFVLGFWKSRSTDDTIISEQFIKDFSIFLPTEWAGIDILNVCGGLDPAFSTGGDSCILRLAIMGIDITGKTILDFQGDSLLYKIKISARSSQSAELQICDQVLEILRMNRCPLSNICIDANGAGRALGGLLQSRANEMRGPIKIYSTRQGGSAVNSFDVIIKSSHELWFVLRDYIEAQQIRGLDNVTIGQLTSRLVDTNKATGSKKLESKAMYKTRMAAVNPLLAHSPDEADAATLCVQNAIINFGFSPGDVRQIGMNNEGDEKYRLHLLQKAGGIDGGEVPVSVPSLRADFSTPIFDLVSFKHPLSRD